MEKEVEHPINYSPEFLEWWEKYERECIHVCTEVEKFTTWQGWQAATERAAGIAEKTKAFEAREGNILKLVWERACEEIAQKIRRR